MVELLDHVVLTEKAYSFPSGTHAIVARYDEHYSSVIEIALCDDNMIDFFDKNKHLFSNFEEYIQYQRDNNVFGIQFWTNPFTTIKVEQKFVKTIAQIEKDLADIEVQQAKLRKEEKALMELRNEAKKGYPKYRLF